MYKSNIAELIYSFSPKSIPAFQISVKPQYPYDLRSLAFESQTPGAKSTPNEVWKSEAPGVSHSPENCRTLRSDTHPLSPCHILRARCVPSGKEYLGIPKRVHSCRAGGAGAACMRVRNQWSIDPFAGQRTECYAIRDGESLSFVDNLY